ncbi:MAG: ADP-ribosylglycohydrolase family protein, partial [Bryobacteraceae bacterium]|nr:ADP-ribosylglycohydrolase family protein [Bryobacteraceae bacterium]
YALWHANLAARRALRRGVPARLSGTPRYNVHANDIDFQIEADFIGLIAPGLPRLAADIAVRAGRVMNAGDGVLGGVFVSCMYAAAFFENDPRRVVEAGLACLPPKSPYARLISDVLAWHRQYPDDWKQNWAEIEKKWNGREPCPAGALRPFNIDARINGAYIALGLLYGGSDMGRTIRISTQAGQDSDCNPSSAAGILGVMMGYEKIPEEWKGGIPAIADRKFAYTDFTFHQIVESTFQRALKAVARAGGQVTGSEIRVPPQPPKPVRVAIWDDYGTPVERIAHADGRWKFTGSWAVDERLRARVSDEKGATAEIEFEGTGFIVTGPYLPDGGFLEAWLDGKRVNNYDVYSDEKSVKGDESVFHLFGLKRGRHRVKLVVLGVRHTESAGARVAVSDLIVFR